MVSAEQARLNQIAASEEFRLAAGEDAFEVQRQLGLISSAERFGNQRQKDAIPKRLEIIRQIVARGTVNFAQLQSPNRNIIKSFFGLTFTTQSGGFPDEQITTIGNLPPEPVSELTASQKGEKVKNMTLPANQIRSIRGVR